MKRSNISIEIGNMIKIQRNIQHMSQESLALEAKMHPSYLGCIERGEKCPTIETLYKISQALNIPVAKLVDIETDNQRKQQENRIISAIENIPTDKLNGTALLIEQLADILKDSNEQ